MSGHSVTDPVTLLERLLGFLEASSLARVDEFSVLVIKKKKPKL